MALARAAHLDFARQGDETRPADVVVLHKVVCCYPDLERLVGVASEHAKRQLAITFPRDVVRVRLGFKLINLLQRIRRRSFRVYLHPPAAVLGVASAHGLEPASVHRGLILQFAGLTDKGKRDVLNQGRRRRADTRKRFLASGENHKAPGSSNGTQLDRWLGWRHPH